MVVIVSVIVAIARVGRGAPVEKVIAVVAEVVAEVVVSLSIMMTIKAQW